MAHGKRMYGKVIAGLPTVMFRITDKKCRYYMLKEFTKGGETYERQRMVCLSDASGKGA